MKTMLSVLIVLLQVSSPIYAVEPKLDVSYANESPRQVLDIYTPDKADKVPVVFWIHGGGWQVGDKKEVQLKPKAFVEHGYIFVATNYRLLPNVEMEMIVRDVAKSLGWVYHNIGQHGGDPNKVFVMGHSAGAQLAALICTDNRYLDEEKVPMNVIRGCVPVDGDTYDIPAIITTAETRREVHKLPQAKYGHREKFGNTPEKHLDFSAVTHIGKGKSIPPFLILYVNDHPDTSAQATRLGNALSESSIPVKLVGAKNTNHSKLNEDLGLPNDPSSKTLIDFVSEQLKSR